MRILIDELDNIVDEVELFSTIYISSEHKLTPNEELDAVEHENKIINRIQDVQRFMISSDKDIIDALNEIKKLSLNNALCLNLDKVIQCIKRRM